MKKIIITGFAFAAILSSCGEAENKIESHEAKEVSHEEVKSTTENYASVKEGSVVNWMGSHIGGVGAHNGTVNVIGGNLTVTDGKLANGKFSIDMSSIHIIDLAEDSVQHKKLKTHLSNADFFNVSNFANATFEVTEVKSIESEEFNSNVTGNLALLGVERSISFDATIDVTENEVAINSQTFTIDRTQWGNEFHKEGTEGLSTDRVISNDITLSIAATIAK